MLGTNNYRIMSHGANGWVDPGMKTSSPAVISELVHVSNISLAIHFVYAL